MKPAQATCAQVHQGPCSRAGAADLHDDIRTNMCNCVHSHTVFRQHRKSGNGERMLNCLHAQASR
eukprot:9763049-Lingulodinium_polyedra.AAC.1